MIDGALDDSGVWLAEPLLIHWEPHRRLWRVAVKGVAVNDLVVL